MKANELRIGNWVNGSHNGFSKDVQVYAFDHKYIQHSNKTNDILPISEFTPIPLSEEILIKAGFKKCSDNGELKGNDCFYVHPDINGSISLPDFGWSLHRVYFKYVHQLQNFYWCLVGEELNINL